METLTPLMRVSTGCRKLGKLTLSAKTEDSHISASAIPPLNIYSTECVLLCNKRHIEACL